MSEKEVTRIAVLETNVTNIMDKLEEFQAENKEQHIALMKKLEEVVSNKADKWVEKVLIWFAITVGTGLISYLGYLLLKLIELK